MRSVRLFFVALLLPMPLLVAFAQSQPPPKGPAAPLLLIRCDDIGMCHAVNTAARQVIAAGIPFSASVMVACPWFLEAVEILRDAPHISVGVHLTLNAEWKHYRWGPVSGAQAVPTLVDSLGYFFPSRKAFFDNRPRMDEVEVELRAQIQRALHAGLRVDYVDYHMGTAVDTPELRRLVSWDRSKLCKAICNPTRRANSNRRAADLKANWRACAPP